MTEKWTSEDILHFLNVYEKYDLLWNIHLTEYRDKNARERALGNLLEELNMDGLTLDIIRTKIKMIKTVYNQERNKIIKSKKTSSGPNDLYKPKLAWFEKADSFLRNVTSTRATANLKKENNDNQLEETDHQETSIYYCEEKKNFPKHTNRTPIKKHLLRKIPSTKHLSKSDVRKRSNMDLVTSAINKLKTIAEYTNKEEDEFDHFGKYIAAQMRQLPILNALHCQEQVLSIITQERVATIQQAEMEASSSQSHWTENQNDFE